MIKAKLLFGVFLTFALLSNALAIDNHALQKQRTLYQQAHKALQTNQTTRFKTLLSQLDLYPLKPYLEYLYLRHHLNQLPEETIAQFLFENQDTFFADRLRKVWLDKLARNKQWQQFLKHFSTMI